MKNSTRERENGRDYRQRDNSDRNQRTEPRLSDRRDRRDNYNPDHNNLRNYDSPNDSKHFGVVVALKDGFGFLQPYNGGEQIYFSSRDAPALREKDEVRFSIRTSARGYIASSITVLSVSDKTKVLSRRGIIQKECDQYRNLPGTIQVLVDDAQQKEVETGPNHQPTPQHAIYFSKDVLEFKSEGVTGKKGVAAAIGDEVQLDLLTIPGTSYCRAASITVLLSKKERLLLKQVKQFVDAGIEKEQGSIESIKNDYGFIKSADRPESLFFRLEDVVDPEGRIPNETDEVEFFVVEESGRRGSKSSDRAVHILFLPFGTVTFEKTLAVAASATVIVEPRVHPHEEPGLLLLTGGQSVLHGAKSVQEVELWSRCSPEGLIPRVGDTLQCDVTLYRPEKLIFARSIKVLSFRKLGRQFGAICDLPQRGGFGFIRCADAETDVYFRSTEVVGAGGGFLAEDCLKVDMLVSFEIIADEVSSNRSSSTGPKLRAIRVKQELVQRPSKVLLCPVPVRGVVVSECKKDVHGVIEVSAVDRHLLPPVEDDVFACYQDIVESIDEFKNCEHWKEVIIEHWPNQLKKVLLNLIRSKYPGIGYEFLNVLNLGGLGSTSLAGSKKQGDAVKVWKMGGDAYKVWADSIVESPPSHPEGETPQGNRSGDGYSILYTKKNSQELLTDSLKVGTELSLEVLLDQSKCIRVASNLSMPDYPVDDGDGRGGVGCCGVMDGKYIRCIPTDERLNWVYSGGGKKSIDGESNPANLKPNQLVKFDIRVRGGIRIATKVEAIDELALESLPNGHFCKNSIVLDGVCLGVVIPGNCIVPVDLSQCPLLQNKIVDLASAAAKAKVARTTKKSSSKSSASKADENSWKKISNKEEEGHMSSSSSPAVAQADASASASVNVETASLVSDAKEDAETLSAPDIKVVHYPALPPPSLPLDLPEGVTFDGDVGKVVAFSAVVSFALQRHPIKAVVSEALISKAKSHAASALLAQNCRIRGTISSLKVNTAPGIDVTEVVVGYSSLHPETAEYYYCDSRELRVAKEHPPHMGGDVEFIPNVALGLAICPTLSRGGSGSHHFHAAAVAPDTATARQPVNNTLKQSFAIKGHKGISMAQGPPNESAKGFAEGWRSYRETGYGSLPWRNLFAVSSAK